MVAVEGERARLGPRPHDQIVRFVESPMRKIRVGARRMVFRTNASHKAGNQPPLRHHVQHRELFGDVDRVIYER
jgi:hypothetical protein